MSGSYGTRWIVAGRRHRSTLTVVSVLIVAALAFVALHRLTEEIRLADVRVAFHALSSWRIAAAIGLSVLSYLALTYYDAIALRIIGRPLPWRTAAYASFTSYTLSHNFGLALLTGGSARYHIYSKAGLDSPDVARVIAIASISFWLGVFAVAACTMLTGSGNLDISGYSVPGWVQTLFGGGCVAMIGMLLLVSARQRSLALFGMRAALPSARQGLALLLVAAVDLSFASAALFVLLPHASLAAWPDFFLAYAAAIIVALISHVPGGIGVFEAIIIAATPGDPADVAAALIAYRLIYYVLPLLSAAGLLGWIEARSWRPHIRRALVGAKSIAGGIAPLLLSTVVFFGGTVLLVSGSLPAVPGRIHDLHALLPLPVIEVSHLAASMTGTALLMLTPGLYRRLDGAFHATRVLLIAGAAFSLLKGFDYEEAVILFGIALLSQAIRGAFYRRTALASATFTPKWIAAVLSVVLLSLWIGFFAFKHVAYSDNLWWAFALKGDASRFMRASVAVCTLLICGAVWRALAPATVPPGDDELTPEIAERALAVTDRTDSMLAFTGDKRFLISPDGDAFLMYQVRGASWIVMGDPIGPPDAWGELFWSMRTKADAAQGRLLFYQISERALPTMIELGLQLVKFGETASVDLAGFSLDGPARRPLRHAVSRAEREGLSFEIVPADRLPDMMGRLAGISDRWLRSKGASEKGFSVGRFDRAYMERFDCAVVRHRDRIIAFANLWATPNKAELSVDLMRHEDDMPYGAMDFLFVQLMLWGKARGYASFSLGMAPLAGIEARQLSPAWSKVAAFIMRHGNSFYGFEGLRAYKNKFAPQWSPRYIASQGGLAFLMALGDVKALINRD